MEATVDYSKEGKEYLQSACYGNNADAHITMIEREAVLKFARELNEKKVEEVLRFDGSEWDIIYYPDFLSVLHTHGIEEKELMK